MNRITTYTRNGGTSSAGTPGIPRRSCDCVKLSLLTYRQASTVQIPAIVG